MLILTDMLRMIMSVCWSDDHIEQYFAGRESVTLREVLLDEDRTEIDAMTVEEIVTQYLRAHNFDGLYNDDSECGCALDDMAPCGEIREDCRAGVIGPCTCGERCDFHIVERLEAVRVEETT